jgi:hypothetical protein
MSNEQSFIFKFITHCCDAPDCTAHDPVQIHEVDPSRVYDDGTDNSSSRSIDTAGSSSRPIDTPGSSSRPIDTAGSSSRSINNVYWLFFYTYVSYMAVF